MGQGRKSLLNFSEMRVGFLSWGGFYTYGALGIADRFVVKPPAAALLILDSPELLRSVASQERWFANATSSPDQLIALSFLYNRFG